MRVRGPVVAVRAGLVALLVVGVAGCGAVGGADPPAPSVAVSAPPTTSADIRLVGGTASSNQETGASGVTDQVGTRARANWQQVSAGELGLGTGVVDVDGRTLYRFDEDSAQPPRSTCDGPCAATWPPVVVKPGGTLYLGSGLDPARVGTVPRSDGSTQITVGGWPVYRFSGDHAAGDTNGQGVKGTWFAVSPEGRKLGVTSGQSAQSPAQAQSPSQAPSQSQSQYGQRYGSGKRSSLTLVRTDLGSVVGDGSGRTVYVTDRDDASPSRTTCTDSCLSDHDPVPAVDDVSIDIVGVRARAVGSVQRPDGRRQMTLEGYPLYTAKDDGRRGDVTGQDGHWFALGLDGDGGR